MPMTDGSMLKGVRTFDLHRCVDFCRRNFRAPMMSRLRRNATETAKAGEACARLAAIVKSSDDAIISKTLDGIITSWNPAAETLFGCPAAEALGKNMADFFPVERREEEQEILKRIARGETIDHFESQRIRKDGRRIDVAVTISPLRDACGRVIGASKIARDITQRKRAETLQLRSQKLEALGTLAGGVAHDFNNILTAIRGSAALAISQLPSEHPVRACLVDIERAGLRAADLVRRILSFSRPQEQNLEEQNLHPLVEEALMLVRAALPANIAIRYTHDWDLPMARVDATQIFQVVLNLATNAIHAIDDRKGLIELKLDAPVVREEEVHAYSQIPVGRYVRLSISDNGCGMDAATLERIFDPFFTTKPTDKGSGLGLSVVHGIVTAHRGLLKVNSEPGKGTVFQIYFPAISAVVEPVRTAEVDVPAGRGEHILLVDNEPMILFVGATTLEQSGYKVTGLLSGAAALAEFQQRPEAFDAVITDLSMPAMSGLQLARELRKFRAEIPILLTSGYFHPEDQMNAEKLGVRALLTKPVNAKELLLALYRIFQERTKSAESAKVLTKAKTTSTAISDDFPFLRTAEVRLQCGQVTTFLGNAPT